MELPIRAFRARAWRGISRNSRGLHADWGRGQTHPGGASVYLGYLDDDIALNKYMSISRWLYWSKKTYALATIAGTESLLGSSAAFSMCYGFPHCLYFVGSFNDENQHIVVVDESICCCR